jgi:hypothetical protein
LGRLQGILSRESQVRNLILSLFFSGYISRSFKQIIWR